MLMLTVDTQHHNQSIVIRRGRYARSELNLVAQLSPTEAEEMALELLAASYLVREKARSRMPRRLKSDLISVLEPVAD